MSLFKYLIGLIIIYSWTGISNAQDTVMDFEGRAYPTILIGKQLWMAENLDTRRGPAGESIESYCFYHDTAYCNKYGRLYSWNVAMAGSDEENVRGICPEGWHIPSDKEWEELLDNLGGYNVAGTQMAVGGESGFNAICAGNYNPILEVFSFIDRNAYFWSSTLYSKNTAWMRQQAYNMVNVNRSTVKRHYCFSIRCVKDRE